MIAKIFVDDKSYDTEDGFTLIAENNEISTIIETAYKNGFTDIRITPPDTKELKEYLINRENN